MNAFKFSSLIALSLALTIGLSACVKPEKPADVSATIQPSAETDDLASADLEKTPIGSFVTEDADGNEITEAVFANAELTMLNVWATFCGYCIDEMPILDQLAGEYADQGFQVIGLIGDVGDRQGGYTADEMASVADIAKKAGANYPTMMPTEDMIESVLWNVRAYPTTMFVDRTGNILGKVVIGVRDENAWRDMIESYLESVAQQDATIVDAAEPMM
ncbi:MAG: TlpA disulfide reductase family protein [Clostridia bacterium]